MYTELCPDDWFKCSNDRCIPVSLTCDYQNDCGNGDDEMCGTFW